MKKEYLNNRVTSSRWMKGRKLTYTQHALDRFHQYRLPIPETMPSWLRFRGCVVDGDRVETAVWLVKHEGQKFKMVIVQTDDGTTLRVITVYPDREGAPRIFKKMAIMNHSIRTRLARPQLFIDEYDEAI